MTATPSLVSQLEDHVAAELDQRIQAALEACVPQDVDCPDRLRDAIAHSLLAPGKRLRPRLVLMACQACGGSIEAALPAACAVELVHTYSLIHDDLPAMDDDDLRRGRPSCHAAFGEATAILAGDALLAMAFELLATQIQPAEAGLSCCAALARTAGPTGLVGGQQADLEAEQTPGGLAELEAIHRRKTGEMLRVCLRLGGLVAAASPAQLASLDAYGRPLGLAFQIVDDLLDWQGQAHVLGKKTQKDAERGKLTFPSLLGVDESQRRAQELIATAQRALEPLGPAATSLRQLAQFVLDRNR